MSEAQAILDEICRRGVMVRVDGETLRLKPREALSDDLLARVRQHKPEIIRALLLTIPTTLCGGCDGDFWFSQSLDHQRRFGQPHARLFPFLGRKVRTPGGLGTLLQVFADRVAVLLDSDLGKCAVFSPEEIRAVAARSDN